MNTKLMIFTGLCALSICTTKLAASTITEPYLETEKGVGPDGDEKIEIRGTCSLAGESAIIAKAGHNMVQLTFTQNIGHVSVSLYDDNGNLVYSCSVDTAVQKMAMLPTTGGHEGTYTIVVENTSDTAVGQFERR